MNTNENGNSNSNTTSASKASTVGKWVVGAGLGPRMAAKFNEAYKAVTWAARGTVELRGIVEKPETHERGMVFVQMFGGPTHPEFVAKVVEVQERMGLEVNAGNYKAFVEAFGELERWFAANPMVVDLREPQAVAEEREAKARVAEEERKRKDEERAAVLTRITGELRAQYPWALGNGTVGDCGANMRRLLAEKWPGVLFSVRKDGYSAYRVGWEMGPTEKEVAAVTQQFRNGRFNGMTDSYDYNDAPARSAWSRVMGSVDYVFENRTLDVKALAVVEAGLVALGWKEEAGEVDTARGVAARLIGKTSLPAGALVTGVEREVEGVAAGRFEDFYKLVWAAQGATHVEDSGAVGVVAGVGVKASLNREKGGVEVKFAAKPDARTIEALKMNGFRWSRFSGCWWAKRTDVRVAFAFGLAGQAVPEDGAAAPGGSSGSAEVVRDPGEDAADAWAATQYGLAG